MHQPLAPALTLNLTGIMPRGMKRKKGEAARIPAANAYAILSSGFVLYVETCTGRANIGACPTADTT